MVEILKLKCSQYLDVRFGRDVESGVWFGFYLSDTFIEYFCDYKLMHQSTQENGGDDIKDDNNIALKH